MKDILKKKQLVDSSYEVQFFIGGNNYHQKYRVKSKDGKTRLLKIYNSSKLSANSFIDGNLFEVEILKSLNQNGTIKYLDHGEIINNNQKYHYIIFEFISGETLNEKLKREGALSSYAAMPVIIDLLKTLEELHTHSQTIIHNNINTHSISLDLSGKSERAILTDFGFARYISSKSNSLDLGSLSPFYVAPELYNGIFTPQSDIFAVGALMYHIIMGIPPWFVEIPEYQHTEEKFRLAIHNERTKPLNFTLRGEEPFEDEHLQETVLQALSVDVDNRFKSASEFIKALKREIVLEGGQKRKQTPQPTPKKKGEGFSAIAGMQTLKDILYNDVIRALNEQELYKSYGVTIPNGMLLFGPPGCGKTFIAERFAEEVGFNFLQLGPSDITSKYINETEEKIGKIFKAAIKHAPTIIFIDELDAVVPSRESDLHHMNAAPVNEFLTQMSNCSEKGVFIIAASNRPEKIDPAILRRGRIDRIIYLSPPDFNARTAMFKLYLKKRPVDLAVNYDELSNLTKNYVSSDIKFLVDEASRIALNTKERITQEILERVISDNKPSVSSGEIKKYEQMKDEFDSKGAPEKKRMGFT